MKKAYTCTFRTPEGNHEIEADSWGCLASMVLSEVSRMIAVCAPSKPEVGLEARAKAMLEVYQERFARQGNRPCSPIASAGLELDLIKCYLQGMCADKTVAWFKKHKNFKTSLSSVGRYWARFSTLGFARR